jgi:protein TonB
MNAPSTRRPASHSPLLIDVVFGGAPANPVSRRVLGWLAALALHAGLLVLAQQGGPSLETWSARVAAGVHRDLHESAPTAIESLPQPEPAPQPTTPPPPEPQAPPPAAKPATLTPRAAPRPAAAPARAAEIVAAEAVDPASPVDLTDNSFVTGSASAYIGGATSAQGVGREVVAGRVTSLEQGAAASGGPTGGHSQPVTLDSEQWRCPWPTEALAQDLYEQAVIVRAWVRADGGVERASVVSDPGYGFGSAALACTLRTRFNPARDARGRAVRALSPPIRVRFTR